MLFKKCAFRFILVRTWSLWRQFWGLGSGRSSTWLRLGPCGASTDRRIFQWSMFYPRRPCLHQMPGHQRVWHGPAPNWQNLIVITTKLIIYIYIQTNWESIITLVRRLCPLFRVGAGGGYSTKMSKTVHTQAWHFRKTEGTDIACHRESICMLK